MFNHRQEAHMQVLILITCTFTLAKTLRDAHEADLDNSRNAS